MVCRPLLVTVFRWQFTPYDAWPVPPVPMRSLGSPG